LLEQVDLLTVLLLTGRDGALLLIKLVGLGLALKEKGSLLILLILSRIGSGLSSSELVHGLLLLAVCGGLGLLGLLLEGGDISLSLGDNSLALSK
jgi:hypothetical protein